MYARLERCEGPECPHCGCNQSEILQQPQPAGETRSWWGSGLARCGHCRATFHFQEMPAVTTPESIVEHQEPLIDRLPEVPVAVPYVTVCCPQCGSDQTRVTSTRRPIRRHKCKACEHRFKSVERKNAE